MSHPKFTSVLGIALISLILLALLLPFIAGLIEGDFGYIGWQLESGWHNLNNESLSYAIKDIYAWSLSRIGFGKMPLSYLVYLYGRQT